MFWKKKQPVTTALEGKAQETKVEVQEPQKAKKLSPKEIMANQIEQLRPEHSLVYRLSKIYWSGLGGFAIVELNPEYPRKGKKYVLSIDKIVEGKPAGNRSHFSDDNNPKGIARWIVDRGGELYS